MSQYVPVILRPCEYRLWMTGIHMVNHTGFPPKQRGMTCFPAARAIGCGTTKKCAKAVQQNLPDLIAGPDIITGLARPHGAGAGAHAGACALSPFRCAIVAIIPMRDKGRQSRAMYCVQAQPDSDDDEGARRQWRRRSKAVAGIQSRRHHRLAVGRIEAAGPATQAQTRQWKTRNMCGKAGTSMARAPAWTGVAP